MYREHRGTLSKEYSDSVQKVDDYKWMVHTTWEVTFKRLSGQSATFLCLCAFLYHDGISEVNFQNTMSNIATHRPCFLATAKKSDAMKVKDFLDMFGALDTSWHSQNFLKVITEIRPYSFLEVNSANETYPVHPLVHDGLHHDMQR